MSGVIATNVGPLKTIQASQDPIRRTLDIVVSPNARPPFLHGHVYLEPK